MNRVDSIFITAPNANAIKEAGKFLKKQGFAVYCNEENATKAIVIDGQKMSKAAELFFRKAGHIMHKLGRMSEKELEIANTEMEGVWLDIGKQLFKSEKGAKVVEATPENLQNMRKLMTQA